MVATQGDAIGHSGELEIRKGLARAYCDVYTPEALAAISALAGFDEERRALMDVRAKRRLERARNKQPIDFLNANSLIAGTTITVQDARNGAFTGSEIPQDLQRQWIQGTGPAARPKAPVEKSLRNVAYALLSGADGWMFDGEDALGQVGAMSLDNQRNLKLAIDHDPLFLRVAQEVAAEMNQWARGFFGHKHHRRVGSTTRPADQDLSCQRPTPGSSAWPPSPRREW